MFFGPQPRSAAPAASSFKYFGGVLGVAAAQKYIGPSILTKSTKNYPKTKKNSLKPNPKQFKIFKAAQKIPPKTFANID